MYPTAEKYAAATDPKKREQLLKKEFEETCSHDVNVVTLAEEFVFDRDKAWEYDEEDSTYGFHMGEVEILGPRRWCVWETAGYDVDPYSSTFYPTKAKAENGWLELCIDHSNVYFDDWEYEEHPEDDRRTSEQIEARVDRQWQFFARATGLPEDVSRELMKARMDAEVVAEITGGNPDMEQLDAYKMLAELRTNPFGS